MSSPIQVEKLGRITFAEGLAIQQARVEAVAAGRAAETLFLLEHEPVYTIGRTPDQTSLRDAALLKHPVVQTNRGGQATYHGPGQLVGYAILDLNRRGRDLHLLLRTLEQGVIDMCGALGLAASRREGLTGVWMADRKLASIGIGVRRWISMHGFAVNVCGDLAAFEGITPCGISGVQMTSLSREVGSEVTMEEAEGIAARIFMGALAVD